MKIKEVIIEEIEELDKCISQSVGKKDINNCYSRLDIEMAKMYRKYVEEQKEAIVVLEKFQNMDFSNFRSKNEKEESVFSNYAKRKEKRKEKIKERNIFFRAIYLVRFLYYKNIVPFIIFLFGCPFFYLLVLSDISSYVSKDTMLLLFLFNCFLCSLSLFISFQVNDPNCGPDKKARCIKIVHLLNKCSSAAGNDDYLNCIFKWICKLYEEQGYIANKQVWEIDNFINKYKIQLRYKESFQYT